MADLRFLRVNLSGPLFALLTLFVAAAPLQRGLFFEADLLPSLLLVALLFAAYALDRANARRPWIPAAGALEAGAALLAVSYLLAFYPAADRRAALLGALEVVMGLLILLMTGGLAATEGRRRTLLRAVVLSGAAAAAFGFLAAAGVVSFPGAYAGGRLGSLLQYPNALGAFMIVAAVAAVGLWGAERRGLWTFVYAPSSYLIVLALLASQSRGAWLVYPPALAVLLMLLPPAARWWMLYAQGAALGLALLVGARVLPLLGEGATRQVLLGLGAGAAAACAVQAVAAAVPALLRRFEPAPLTVALLRYGAAAYVLVLAVVYLAYATSIPAGTAALVPQPVLARAESVSLDDPSAVMRGLAARDALMLIRERPLLGAGAGGWDALYHRVQSYPYWTTEVHSHPLQVAVEAGLPGLAGLLLAAGGALRLGLAARARDSEAEPELTAAVALSALAGLFAHAAFDFDLSLPGLGVVFWSLAGTVRAAHAAAHPPVLPPLPLPRVLSWATAGLVLAALVGVPAWRLNEARTLGQEAALAFRAGELGRARTLYERALALDPWQGTYAVDLAQVHIARQLAGFDPLGFARAEDALAHALRVQPYRYVVRGEAVRLYALMGRTELALRAAHDFVWMAPLDPHVRGLYATLLAGAALERLEAGDAVAARALLERVYRLERDWQSLTRRLERRPPGLPAPRLDDARWALGLGQAYLMDGRLDRAVPLLERAAARESAAVPWLAAARYLQGRRDAAFALLATSSEGQEEARRLFVRLLAVHGFAMEERP